MNKIILTLAMLAAVSTSAFAERNYDLRDSPEQRGSFTTPADLNQSSGVNLLQAVAPGTASQTILFGKYGYTSDPAELRRWDEKNGG